MFYRFLSSILSHRNIAEQKMFKCCSAPPLHFGPMHNLNNFPGLEQTFSEIRKLRITKVAPQQNSYQSCHKIFTKQSQHQVAGLLLCTSCAPVHEKGGFHKILVFSWPCSIPTLLTDCTRQFSLMLNLEPSRPDLPVWYGEYSMHALIWRKYIKERGSEINCKK